MEAISRLIFPDAAWIRGVKKEHEVKRIQTDVSTLKTVSISEDLPEPFYDQKWIRIWPGLC
jgi:hypothetical protein